MRKVRDGAKRCENDHATKRIGTGTTNVFDTQDFRDTRTRKAPRARKAIAYSKNHQVR